MNKRFVIFVLSMTVVLFFVNQYFTGQKQKEYDTQQQKEELTEERHLSREENIAARRAHPQDLPLVQVYSDGEERLPLTWAAIAGERSYLVTSWGKEWPKSVVIGGQSARLVETDDHFALYSTSYHPEIDSVYLPQLGTHDVQVVTFSEEGPLVTLGEYDDGQLFFPSVIPQKNGVVLYRIEGQYLPVGVWSGNFLPLMKLTNFTPLVHYRVEQAPLEKMTDQDYFVLENETMQVVFSNLGGAIAEINLPFRSEKDDESVVLPINFDRIIKKKYTSNSHFPSHTYERVERGQVVTKQPTTGGYYPLLRRGIEPGSGIPPQDVPPRFYPFNTLSEDPETAQAIYKVVDFNETMIRFEANFPNRRIIKTYSLPKQGAAKAPYCLDVAIKVDGDTRGLWVGSGVPEVELISGSPAPTIKFSTVQNNKRVVEKLSLPKLSTTMSAIQPDWVSNSNGYFTLIMDPVTSIGTGFQANNIPGNLDPSRITMVDASHDLYPASKYPGYEVHMPLRRTSEPMRFRFYAGPIDKNVLTVVDNTFTDPVTGYSPKYTETQSFHGWFSFISEPFAKFLYLILDFFHMITGSWGFSIILLTVVLRVMMYPLNAWSIKSTLRMQEISPQLQKLQAKNKKDPKKAQMEMMAFYKEHKINPFGGCLPLIIQMPFLFGMFDLLKSTFPLRGASFIPGWIDNLTAPDVVFSWSYPIPFIGTSFHLLPILLGVVMFFQQKMAAAQNKNKGPLTDQQIQQQKMGKIMTIVFTFLFYKFPSGLNIYWLSSMALQVLQQWYMAKRRAKGKKDSREVLVKAKKNLP